MAEMLLLPITDAVHGMIWNWTEKGLLYERDMERIERVDFGDWVVEKTNEIRQFHNLPDGQNVTEK